MRYEIIDSVALFFLCQNRNDRAEFEMVKELRGLSTKQEVETVVFKVDVDTILSSYVIGGMLYALKIKKKCYIIAPDSASLRKVFDLARISQMFNWVSTLEEVYSE